MVKMIQQLAQLKPGTNGYGNFNKKTSVTIHQTGNTKKGANAKMHANLQSNGYGASWHWQVDENIAIQSFLHNWSCYHASDGRGPGNMNSIAIEGCINEDGDYIKTVHNMAELAAHVLKTEGLPISQMKQHHDFDTKYHKNCPAQIRAGKAGIGWALFVQMVKDNMAGHSVSKPSSKPAPAPQNKPTGLDPNSIHDYLISIGEGTDSKNRARLAVKYGIVASEGQYKGTAAQNVALLANMRKGVAKPKPVPKPAPSVNKGAKISADGKWGTGTTKALQLALGVGADGIISGQFHNGVTDSLYNTVHFGVQGSPMVRSLQNKVGVKADGYMGPNTIKALQRFLGTPVDGIISRPFSNVVKALQDRLNAGTF